MAMVVLTFFTFSMSLCSQNIFMLKTLFMSLLRAPVVKKVIFRLEFTLFSEKHPKNKPQSLLIPNLNFSEKIGKAVTK